MFGPVIIFSFCSVPLFLYVMNKFQKKTVLKEFNISFLETDVLKVQAAVEMFLNFQRIDTSVNIDYFEYRGQMQFKPALAGGTVSTCVTNIINIKHQAQLYQGDKHYFRSGFTLSIPVFRGLVSFFFCGFFFFLFFAMILLGFPGRLEGKASACSVRDLGSAPGKGNGNPLQYSCLEIPWMEEPGRLQSMGLKRVGYD